MKEAIKENGCVLAIGFNTMDYILDISGSIITGKKMYASSIQEYCGGQAANCAYTLATLGCKVSYIGKFGDDRSGLNTMASLKEMGIDLSSSRVIEACPNHIGIIFRDEESGERTIIMRKDSRLSLSADEASEVSFDGVVCIYSDGNESVYSREIMKRAYREGICTVLDIERIDDDILETLPYTTVLIAPGEIISKIAGEEDNTLALKKISEKIETVVATLGSEGSIGINMENQLVCVPAEKCAVRDTTGAGDAYHAGFIDAMLQGKGLEECMAWATKVAALKCETDGPRIKGREHIWQS